MTVVGLALTAFSVSSSDCMLAGITELHGKHTRCSRVVQVVFMADLLCPLVVSSFRFSPHCSKRSGLGFQPVFNRPVAYSGCQGAAITPSPEFPAGIVGQSWPPWRQEAAATLWQCRGRFLVDGGRASLTPPYAVTGQLMPSFLVKCCLPPIPSRSRGRRVWPKARSLLHWP